MLSPFNSANALYIVMSQMEVALFWDELNNLIHRVQGHTACRVSQPRSHNLQFFIHPSWCIARSKSAWHTKINSKTLNISRADREMGNVSRQQVQQQVLLAATSVKLSPPIILRLFIVICVLLTACACHFRCRS